MGKLGVAFATLLFVVQAQAEQNKKMSDYWAELDLPYTLFSDGVTSKSCYKNLNNFLGCVHGSNAILQRKGLAIMPETRVEGNPLVKKVVEDWGKLKLVETTPLPKAKTVMESVNRMKAERDQGYRALKTVFEAKEATVDFQKVTSYIEKEIVVEGAPKSEIVADGINGYLGAALDPHTRISPEKYFADERSSSTQSFSGIGVMVRELDEKIVVIQPVEGGPAHKAGIRAKDVITHVNGQALSGLSLEDAMKLIKGPKGTEAVLTVRRKEASKEIRVVRDSIVTKNVEAKMLTDDRRRVGYVKLGDFVQGKPGQEVKAAVEELQKAKADSIIFDLRGNGGGLIDQAVEVANVFLPKDATVVISKDLMLGFPSPMDTEGEQTTTLPLTTLLDAGSASASELVSGALQDHKRGLILGERSFGKGTVQGVRPFGLAEGVLMIRTQATFHMPSGRSNQLLGIVPDVTVYKNPNPTEEDKFAVREEDLYMNALPSTSESFKPLQPELVSEVSGCLEREGRAKAVFAEGQEDALLPDYQLLVAQDAAACIPH